jgi:hypothetical protein
MHLIKPPFRCDGRKPSCISGRKLPPNQ